MTRPLSSALFALALFVVACDGSDIVVFSPAQAGAAGTSAGSAGMAMAGMPSGGFAGSSEAGGSGGAASGAGGSGDKSCQTTDDCDSSWYCQKQNCDDPAGVCLPGPISDDPQLLPVCGCDHITYWNDTLRKIYGISASTPGACMSGAKACYTSDECGPDGTCSHQLRNLSDCGMPGSGQCWIIPNDCGATDARQDFLPCPPSGPPSPGCPPVLTICQALQSDQPFLRTPKNYHCP